ncbi:ATP-binding protein [Nannocystis sp.]|uniref:ATP-binding protein n=1 Tax=Nannocystis sp. TaxID=1962667 RepID=UPI0024285817|nr:ATP-binding protein [Nannocystis sp.]MBK7823654.1 ATP-binding protein [Nannocystis sp.]MBK9755834.1 ATP-binding protein [Nannocystis sp.]
MPDHAATPRPNPDGDTLAARIAVLANRLADRLAGAALGTPANEFLARIAAEQRALPPAPNPELARLVARLGLDSRDIDILVLAGLAEEHEGFASLFAQLHPRSDPYPTVALAAQLLTPDPNERPDLLRRLWGSPTIDHALVEVAGTGPFPTRDLRLGEALWPALHGIDAWPRELARSDDPIVTAGLEEWLASPDVAAACTAIRADAPVLVLVHADDPAVAIARALALVHAAARHPRRIDLSEKTASLAPLACVHALLRACVPTFTLTLDGPNRPALPVLRHPGAIVLAGRPDTPVTGARRTVLPLACTRLPAAALRRMWTHAAPSLAASADLLAARFPLEPAEAHALVASLPNLDLATVAASVRARGWSCGGAGIKVVQPSATWRDLVLPADHLHALRDAVDRVRLQPRVLDDWGFLAGRAGARGVRMLFCGPPGTGKTLSAEVLAHALATDLFIVDVSRVVSKWIGETEKNLSEAFDAAERSRAVLLFDEADALFGKRTEVADAHDRYANLETAYLLSRLERYEGLAILTSNLRQNIDAAFIRRMDFIVGFEAPGRDERAALWRCHIPADAPVAADVAWTELASLYPVVGGVIRNAALAAAYFAAADDAPISRAHLVRALRREYEKIGKAFPTSHAPPHSQGAPHRG